MVSAGVIAYMVKAALGADDKKASPLSESAACSINVVARPATNIAYNM